MLENFSDGDRPQRKKFNIINLRKLN